MSASPMVSLRSPRILVVPLLLALGSAVTAQGIERPPHPGLGVVTGSHVFALEFVDEAFDASRCADVARRIQVEEPLLSPGLVGVAIRTRESFSAKAKEGGLPGNRHSEVMEWVVRGEKDYLIHVRPGGNHARSSPVASVRTLYRDGLKIYRADRDGVEPSAATFFVDDEVESYSDCPLFAEWEVHARMVAYCLDSGAAGSNGLVVVSAAVVASAPPIQVPFDSQTDSYTLLREWVEGATRFRISAYDAQGRVCREWSSTWVQGEPRQLLSRSYVAFTQDLLNTRDFRLLSRDPDAQLPDFAQITSLPFDRDAARDLRTEVPYVFDPRRGLPERPKTMAAITEERIQKLRRDRESGVRNKFTDNLDALDAAEGGAGAQGPDGSNASRGCTCGGLQRRASECHSRAADASDGVAVARGVARYRGDRGLGDRRLAGPRAQKGEGGVGTLLLGLLATSCADVSATVPLAGPTLDVCPRTLAATVDRGAEGWHQSSFWITNRRGDPVRLLDAGSSCGCVRVKLSASTVAPFSTVRCTLEYLPKDLKPVEIRLLFECKGTRASELIPFTPVG